jgi:hypothetical protein
VLSVLLLTRRLEVLGPVGIYSLDRFGAQGSAAVLATGLVAVSLGTLAAGYVVFRKVVS